MSKFFTQTSSDDESEDEFNYETEIENINNAKDEESIFLVLRKIFMNHPNHREEILTYLVKLFNEGINTEAVKTFISFYNNYLYIYRTRNLDLINKIDPQRLMLDSVANTDLTLVEFFIEGVNSDNTLIRAMKDKNIGILKYLVSLNPIALEYDYYPMEELYMLDPEIFDSLRKKFPRFNERIWNLIRLEDLSMIGVDFLNYLADSYPENFQNPVLLTMLYIKAVTVISKIPNAIEIIKSNLKKSIRILLDEKLITLTDSNVFYDTSFDPNIGMDLETFKLLYSNTEIYKLKSVQELISTLELYDHMKDDILSFEFILSHASHISYEVCLHIVNIMKSLGKYNNYSAIISLYLRSPFVFQGQVTEDIIQSMIQ
jgi:hypothetical protein